MSNNPIDDAAGRADPNNACSIQPTIASANDKIYIAWEGTTPAIESDTDNDIFIHSFKDGVIQEFDGLYGTYRKHFKFATRSLYSLSTMDGVMLTFIELDSLSFSEIKYAILRQSGVMTSVSIGLRRRPCSIATNNSQRGQHRSELV